MGNINDFRDPTTGKVDWDAYDKAYEQEQRDRLTQMGFRPKLTQEQIYVITEPSEAPENYACDGEISPSQMKTRWLNNLKRAGLTPQEIKLARKLNGI